VHERSLFDVGRETDLSSCVRQSVRMGETALTLRQADEGTIGYVERVLARNGLPERDVRSKPDCFYVASAGDRRVGIGGLELHGPAGLLRSVVVEEPHRGAGLGTALCAALEARASAEGVETLYLLTTSATEFFDDRGYVAVDRCDAPDAIRGTTEFEALCPTTATCLRKSL